MSAMRFPAYSGCLVGPLTSLVTLTKRLCAILAWFGSFWCLVRVLTSGQSSRFDNDIPLDSMGRRRQDGAEPENLHGAEHSW